MISLHERKNVADLGEGRTRDLLVSSQMRIQFSHWGQQLLKKPTDLDLHCMWMYINNLDQVIWLAEN